LARITRYLILGAVGGLLGWAVAEPIDYLTPAGDPDMTYTQVLLLGAVIGLFVGAGLGVAEALSGVSPRDAMKSVVFGIGVGTVGGGLGLAFGNTLYHPILQLAGDTSGTGSVAPIGPPSFLSFFLRLIGRSLGWALFGLLLGLSQGLSTESNKKMLNGAVGGFLGGAVGGFVFALLASMNRTGAIAIPVWLMRLIGFSLTGAAIGLFISFIEEMAKRAWLVHLKGRNEGREFQIFKPETIVGRDELVDIPIFGDPDVEPRHFVIRADQRRHLLKDLNTAAGTIVNGQKVQQKLLRDGDMIQIGMTKLLFRDKATRSLIQRPVDAYPGPAGIPTSEHICPFCGEIKDANGNCACTVGAGAAAGQTPDAGGTVGAPPPTAAQPPSAGQSAQPGWDPFAGTPLGAPAPSAEVTGAPKLVGISGPYAGQTFSLAPDGETTIGRQSDRSIPLASDNTVSRQHARVVNEAGRFVLYDMGSSNGTFANNARITRHELTNGDLVQIGSTKFRYEG